MPRPRTQPPLAARTAAKNQPAAPDTSSPSPPRPPSGIRDNRDRGKAGDFLDAHLHPGTRLSVVSGYFTINAYGALRGALEDIDRMRFLYGAHECVGRMERDDKESKAFRLTEQGLTLTRQLSQRALARRCAEWIRRKTDIRSVRSGFLHGKMYHLRSGGHAQALLGSSNFLPCRASTLGPTRNEVAGKGSVQIWAFR